MVSHLGRLSSISDAPTILVFTSPSMSQDTQGILEATTSLLPSSSNSPELIKRAPRTYGRRREPVELQDCSFESVSSLGDAKLGTETTSSPGALPPSSPLDDLSFTSSASPFKLTKREGMLNQKDLGSVAELEVPAKYRSGIREKLQKINDEFDAMEDSQQPNPRKESFFGNTTLLLNPDDNASSPRPTTPPLRAASEDFFTASGLLPSSAPIQSSHSSPGIPRRGPRRRSQFVPDSESEDDLPKPTSSTTASVSGQNIFGSQKARSSSTEPTTDEELPSKISRRSEQAAAKKPSSGRLKVAPLDFKDVPSSSKAKKPKKDKKGKQKVSRLFIFSH